MAPGFARRNGTGYYSPHRARPQYYTPYAGSPPEMVPFSGVGHSETDSRRTSTSPRSPPYNTKRPAWDMDTLKTQIIQSEAGKGAILSAIENCTFKPREQAFTALIDLCGRMRDYPKAQEVFDAMKCLRGVRPNKYSYSALIAACSSSGEWQKALDVFAQMQNAAKTDPNCRPNQVTYGALISACERGGMHEMALEKFEEMRSGGIKPDQVTYTSVLCSCEKSAQWEKAEEILEEAHSRGFVGPPSIYCELMLFYASKKTPASAVDLFLAMQMAGVEADVHTCRALMEALEAGAQSDMALELLDSMEKNDVPIDIETYNLALRALAANGEWQQAIHVLKGICSAGLEPGSETLHIVAEACITGDQPAIAKRILSHVKN